MVVCNPVVEWHCGEGVESCQGGFQSGDVILRQGPFVRDPRAMLGLLSTLIEKGTYFARRLEDYSRNSTNKLSVLTNVGVHCNRRLLSLIVGKSV